MKNSQVTLTKVTKLSNEVNTDEITKEIQNLEINEIQNKQNWTKVGLHRKGSNQKNNKNHQKPTNTGKSVNATTLFRKHETLHRTTSVPIKIPLRHKGREKQELTRVNSVGISRLSPGGTRRIMYNRHFLLECRQSPLSSTPPTNLPIIPGATVQSGKQRRAEKKRLEKMDSQISNCSLVSVSSTNQSTDDELL